MKRHILSKKTFQRISTLSVIAGATIMGPLSFGAEVAGIPYAPAAMNDVQLGMQVDEIKRIFSNTKEIGDAKRNLLFAYFENAPIWEAAMFDFKAGRLTAVSLLKGVTTTANVPELLRNVSRELVRVLGREFKALIVGQHSEYR